MIKKFILIITVFSFFSCENNTNPLSSESEIRIELTSTGNGGLYYFTVTNFLEDSIFFYKSILMNLPDYHTQTLSDTGWTYCEDSIRINDKPNTRLLRNESFGFGLRLNESCPAPWRVELYFFKNKFASKSDVIRARSSAIKK